MKRITLLLALGSSLALLPSIARAATGLIGSSHDFTSAASFLVTTTVTPSGGSATVSTGQSIALFAAGGGGTYTNPCQVCHIPHKATSAGNALTNAPLWNHVASGNVGSYVTYDQGQSAHFNSLGLTVTLGSSLACLSCHDGSMAINQAYGSAVGAYSGGGVTAGTSKTGTVTTVTPVYVPTFAVEASQPGTANFTGPSGSSGPFAGQTDLTHMHPIGVSYTAALKADPTLQPLGNAMLGYMLKGTTQTVECASCHDIHRVYGASNTATHDLIVDVNNAALCNTCHQQ
jgi:hypothetical protein